MANLLLLAFALLSVAGGYAAVILTYLVLTFGLTSMSPGFVMQRGQFSNAYVFLHPVLWLGSGIFGGYVTASIATWQPYIMLGLLSLIVARVIFRNGHALNARHGGRSRAMMAFMAVIGIFVGGYLQ